MAMCEDFPCCGHEMGDCGGGLYGSDESIMNDPHLLCDHEMGECRVADYGDDYDECNLCGGEVEDEDGCDCQTRPTCFDCDAPLVRGACPVCEGWARFDKVPVRV